MFEGGDFLLLCSDGLSNKVNEKEMVQILQNEDSLEQKASSLINIANENGGEDNITLIILEYANDIELGDNQ
jgi:PPM family protein phosphatase